MIQCRGKTVDSFPCISWRPELSSSILSLSFIIQMICGPAPVKSSVSLISPPARWCTWVVSITFHFLQVHLCTWSREIFLFLPNMGAFLLNDTFAWHTQSKCWKHKEVEGKKKEIQNTSLLILSRWHWLRRKEKGRGGGGESSFQNPSTLHCAVKSYVTAAGNPSTLLVQLRCTRTQLKGKTLTFHYLNRRAEQKGEEGAED